jgi:hypothetical protein
VLNPIKFQNVETMDANQKLNIIKIQKLRGKNLNKFLKKNPKKLKYWTVDKN